MYNEHYGLNGNPFQLTPDARFWFESETHKKAMAYLGYGLAQGEGFIVVTGDIGAGKTTLVGHLMATIDTARLTAVQIVSTQVEGEDMLRLVAQQLGTESRGLTKAELLDRIERFLHGQARDGKRTLLIVDEAQNLSVSALEELRMLSNFQSAGGALLQIFLLGQPEFRDRVRSASNLEQLRQRVIATHHLDPMHANEIEPYIEHRLSIAGWDGRPHFAADAYEALYAATDGVPRRLNTLMARLLLFGAVENLDMITGDAVTAVLADLADEEPGQVGSAAKEPSSEIVSEQAENDDFEEPNQREPDTAEPDVEFVEQHDDVSASLAIFDADHKDEEQDDVPKMETADAFDLPEPEAEELNADPEIAELDAEPDVQHNVFAPFATIEPGFTSEEQDDFAEPGAAEAFDLPDSEAVDREAEDKAGEPEILEEQEDRVSAEADGPVFEPTIVPESEPAHEERIAALEARVDEQNAALRRVLTLLVQWVEEDTPQSNFDVVRGDAA